MKNSQLAIRPTADLLSSDTQLFLGRAVSKIMKLTPNGSKLTDDQAKALAVYSYMTDLNPFSGECYWMDGIGPTPGVAGYRRKAKEQNLLLGNDYWVEFKIAEPHEADFNPDAGDVAWKCILHDYEAEKKHRQSLLELYREFRQDPTIDSPIKKAEQFVGTAPTWDAVGVVSADEHFSAPVYEDWKTKKIKRDENGKKVYKPEMWDRNERAKKRAEKGALKKRYPDVLIPEFREIADANVTAAISQISAPTQSYDVAETKEMFGVSDPIIDRVAHIVEHGTPDEEFPYVEPPNPDNRPWIGEEVKNFLIITRNNHAESENLYDDDKGSRKGAMIGKLNELFGGSLERHAVTEYVFGVKSLSNVPDAVLLAFSDWLSVKKVGDDWVAAENVPQEARNVLKQALINSGQMELFKE